MRESGPTGRGSSVTRQRRRSGQRSVIRCNPASIAPGALPPAVAAPSGYRAYPKPSVHPTLPTTRIRAGLDRCFWGQKGVFKAQFWVELEVFIL